MTTATVVTIIIAIGFASLFIYQHFNNVKQGQAHEQAVVQAKQAYDEALKSGDKKAALEAGRKYYSILRGGKLSVYDEQALSNDLNTMS